MNNRRRKFWIDRDVQGALVSRVIFHWLLLFAISALFLPMFRLLNAAQIDAPFSTLLRRAWVDTAPIFVFMLLLLPFFVWDTVKLSNRFAGPMYRIRKALGGLAAGKEVDPIRLRDDDFWKEAAHDFNVVRERLQSLEASAGNRTDKKVVTTSVASAGSAAATKA
jgi:hypothetical protein